MTSSAERERLLGDLTPNLCHELAQPITAIANFAAAAAAQATESPVLEMLDQIQQQAERAAELVRLWRRFSFPDDAPPADAATAARDALTLVAPELRRQRVRATGPAVESPWPVSLAHRPLVELVIDLVRAMLPAAGAGAASPARLIVAGEQTPAAVRLHFTWEAAVGIARLEPIPAALEARVADQGGRLSAAPTARTWTLTLPAAEWPGEGDSRRR